MGVLILKTKQKIFLLIIVIAIAGSVAWYFSPKTFLSGITPSNVESISVFDGNTGKGFVIGDLTEVEYIVRNIQDIAMERDNISVGYSGYRFRMSFNDSNGKEIDSFVINGADTIRDDPFFYRCSGDLCFNYLMELEDKYAK